jgi:hypothetical protein
VKLNPDPLGLVKPTPETNAALGGLFLAAQFPVIVNPATQVSVEASVAVAAAPDPPPPVKMTDGATD